MNNFMREWFGFGNCNAAFWVICPEPGGNKDELEKRQLIKLSTKTKADRTSLASIPLPYLVAQ